MSERGNTEGACAFCGKRATRGGMSRHLRSCAARRSAVAAAGAATGSPQTLVHLVAQNPYGGQFWLHLEMRGSATLQKLDDYLRAMWLECCGHMSQFSRGRWRGDEIAMRRKVQDVFAPATEITHTYDFGTETVTLVKAVDTRVGQPLGKRPIYLMARNEMPSTACQECGEPGTHLCRECVYASDNPILCAAHASTHPHEDYGEPVALVNSPRMGECGYDGPAEPPY